MADFLRMRTENINQLSETDGTNCKKVTKLNILQQYTPDSALSQKSESYK